METCSFWATLYKQRKAQTDCGRAVILKEGRISLYYDTFPQWMVFANFVKSCNTWLGLANNVDYIWYFVYIPVPSVNYCDRLGLCFRLVCIYAWLLCFLMLPYFRLIKIYIKYGMDESNWPGTCLTAFNRSQWNSSFWCFSITTQYFSLSFSTLRHLTQRGIYYGDVAVCVSVTLIHCAQTTESIIMRLRQTVAQPF